ncbi:MAG TPA: VWA domain-containing protein [Phycisphaerales bacterium]|nr:VWA domain-containing protein [Phycisphaerales bacterium]
MTFLTWPLAAIAGAIAVPLLVLLYFLKLKRRDMEVSTTLLWKKAIQDLQANAPFQKLRRNILLLLQLLVLAAVLLALAQPELRDRGITNQRHIILIDRSASMSSLDGELRPVVPPSATTDANGAAASSPASFVPEPIDGKTSRLDAAKKEALSIIDALKEPGVFDTAGAGEEAMIIAFDSTAEVRQVFTSNKGELRAAVNAIEPTDAPTSIDRAYTLAQAYTGKEKFEENKGFVPVGPPASLHIISDGRLPDAEKVRTGPQDKVYYHAVGSNRTNNVGVTSVRALRAFDDPRKLSVFVGIQSTARQPMRVEASVSLDGNLVETRDIEVAAATPPARNPEDPADEGKPWVPGLGGFVFSVERAEAGVGSVRIRVNSGTGAPTSAASSDNVLTTDDEAYFVFPPARRLSVAVVTEGNLWLKFGLESLNLSRVEFFSLAKYQSMLDQKSGDLAGFDVVVFDKVLPMVEEPGGPVLAPVAASGAPPAPGAPPTGASATPTSAPGAPATAPLKPAPPKRIRSLPPGRALVLGAVPAPPLGANTLGKFDLATVADVQRDHPALGLAGLDKLALGEGVQVELVPDTPVKSLANSDKGPVVLEVADAATHALVLTFDPFSTNWPLDSGWVLFLADSLTYLGDVNTGSSGFLTTGSTLQARVPDGAADVRIALPEKGSVHVEPGVDSTVAYGPVNQTGLYTLSWTGAATAIDVESGGRVLRVIAANLTDPSESDTAASPTLSLAKEVVTADQDKQSELTRRFWPWLLLAALGVVLLEWFVYNRKVTV